MKLIIATDNYPPRYDGVSRFLLEVIPALADKHTAHVICPDYGSTQDPWPVTKIPLARWNLNDFHPAKFRLRTVFSLVKQSDAVFLQTIGPIGITALISARILKKKTVLFTHSIEWELVPKSFRSPLLWRITPSIVRAIQRMLFRWVNWLIVPSESVSEKLYWHKIENKRAIVNLGVDVHSFKPPRNKDKAKEKLGIAPDTLVIGYHGRLAREKDLKTLLRGYLRFKSLHPKVKSQLLIVGDGLKAIRNMLDREDVIITGFQKEVVPYLQAMDIYVLSSQTETTSLSVMEAMACGLPVASTPVGFVNDYIDHEKNGFLYSEKGTVELGFLLSRLTNKKLREKIGKAARETMVKKFSWDITRRKIVQVFTKL